MVALIGDGAVRWAMLPDPGRARADLAGALADVKGCRACPTSSGSPSARSSLWITTLLDQRRARDHRLDRQEDPHHHRGRGHLRHHQRDPAADHQDHRLRVLRADARPDLARRQRAAVHARPAGSPAASACRSTSTTSGRARCSARSSSASSAGLLGLVVPGQGRAEQPRVSLRTCTGKDRGAVHALPLSAMDSASWLSFRASPRT